MTHRSAAGHPRRRVGRWRAAAGSMAMVGALVLAGCSDDPNSLSAQARSGDQKGYISADGTVETLTPQERKEPVNFTGTTLDGEQWSRDKQGKDKVVVLNLWGSWCPPCIEEAPELQEAWDEWQKADDPVVMLGLLFKDTPDNAAAFMRSEGITYPSLVDDGGQTLLNLQGKVQMPPTTLVIDRQGRIAARVAGPVSKATLTGLVEDVLAEGA